MPRGNPNVWKKHGASYTELAGTITSVERAQDIAPRRLPPVAPGALVDIRATKPAGWPSLKPHKEVGSFVLQPNWSLGVAASGGATAAATSGRAGGDRRTAQGAGPGPSSCAAAGAPPPPPPAAAAGGVSRWVAVSAAAGGGPVTADLPPRCYSTESKSNFGAPPSDFRRTRSAGPGVSQMPQPDHVNDWKTSKQVDFRPELTAGAPPPPPPFRAHGSGPLLPTDVPPNSQFLTQHRTQFQGGGGGGGQALRDSQALRPSGARATQAAPYNIITGAVSYSNNAFEHWDGRDYRRHR